MSRVILLLLVACGAWAQTLPVSSGATVGRVLALDRFTGSDGTLLASHAMDRGGGWTLNSGGLQISGGKLIATTSTNNGATVDVGTPNYRVSVRFTFGTAQNVHLRIRWQDASNYISAYVTSLKGFALRKYVASTGTYYGSDTVVVPNLTAGAEYTLWAQCSGSWLAAGINDVVLALGYDSYLADKTKIQLVINSNTAGWAMDDFRVEPFGVPGVPAYPTLAVDHAASPLATPSYDGQGQATNPDVLYAGAGWHGYKYWMAYTPFTNSNNTTENPSILASNDGDSWVVPDGLTNPIDPTPAGAYNSDTDLVLGPGGVLYCFYRAVATGVSETVYYRTSADGVTWGDEQVILSWPYVSVGNIQSPAFMWDGANWRMWYSDRGHTNSKIALKIAPTLAAIPDAPTIYCYFDNLWYMAASTTFWHLDVFRDGSKFVMLLNMLGAGNAYNLHLAESYDGVHWATSATPLLTKGAAGAWDDTWIYRSTALPVSGGYDLFYAGKNSSEVWHVGRSTITVQ